MKSTFSVIIPVLNEPAIIDRTIQHVREICNGYEVEIIVVDGNGSGDTVNSIKDPAVKKIISRQGRGKQMNAGASSSAGDVLLFLHADTELPEDAFLLIDSAMKDKSNVCGSFTLGIASDRRIFRLIENMVRLRTRWTLVPYGDQAIFIRRENFTQLGGFADIPIMEDVELMQRAKKKGCRIRVLPQKVKTSARKWEHDGVIYTTFRNWFLSSLYLLGVKPEKLVKFYYRH